MGFFDSLKSKMGLVPGEMEVRIQPESLHVGGEVRGVVQFRAQKPVNMVSVVARLAHTFPVDEYSTDTDIVDEFELARMISFQAGDHQEWPFYFALPPQVAASMGRFGWSVHVVAQPQSGGAIRKEQAIQVRMSPIMSAVFAAVQGQFGFQFEETGADDDGIWAEFRPTGPVRAHFQGLEIAYDEQDDEVTLWVSLSPFRPHVIDRFHDAYDHSENSIELVLPKRDLVSGDQADAQAIFERLQPLFSLH